MFVLALPGPDEPRTKKTIVVLEAGLAQCEFYRDCQAGGPTQDLLDDIKAYKLILANKAYLAEYTMNFDANILRATRQVARDYGWME